MSNQLYVWVDKKLNIIGTLPDFLPENWKNYNGMSGLSEGMLNELGWYKINDLSLINYGYSDEWLNQFKKQLLQKISNQRWEAQTEAVTYNGNVYILNDSTINALHQKRTIVASDPTATFTWKTRDSMVQLTSTDLINLTNSINSYIQECFDIEETFIGSVLPLNTLEDLLQVNLNITWPSTTLS
jgi:hypothetical protein